MSGSELTSQQREDLVAYLDGELDEDASEAIEKLLVRSEEARQEVESLERTWDLLDVLPQVRASDTFTARTMSTVRVSGGTTTVRPRVWPRRFKRSLLAAACLVGLLASAAAGFYFAHALPADGSEELLRDLPVLERLDVYREVKDVEFLRGLAESGILDEDSESSPE